jgi:hypothetical protein
MFAIGTGKTSPFQTTHKVHKIFYNWRQFLKTILQSNLNKKLQVPEKLKKYLLYHLSHKTVALKHFIVTNI